MSLTASAAQSLVFDLEVEPEHQPTHICVISTAGSRSGDFYYSMPLERFKDAYDAVQRGEPPSLEHAHSEMADALLSLRPIGDASECERPYGECSPSFDREDHYRTYFSEVQRGTTTRSLHIVCGHNSAHAETEGDVLVLSLNSMEEDDVPISEVRLDGNVGVITLARGAPTNAVGRIAGGHYVPGRSYVVLAGRMRIPLDPLCSTHTVELPRANLNGTNVDQAIVRRNDAVVRTCQPNVEVGKFDIVLPYMRKDDKFLLEVGVESLMQFIVKQFRPREGESDDVDLDDATRSKGVGSLRARWTGRRRDGPIVLGFTEVSFSWSPDCTYEGTTLHYRFCPEARVGGKVCENTEITDPVSCHYDCQTSSTFELPASVEFSSGAERWRAQLDFPGQDLRDYVPPEQRRIRVKFGGWAEMVSRELVHIDGVRVKTGSQTTYIDLSERRAGLGKRKVGGMPPRTIVVGADFQCRDGLDYQVEGDTLYDGSNISVRRGAVVLPQPQSLSLANGRRDIVLEPVIGVSVGHRVRLGSDPSPPTGPGDGFDVRLAVAGQWHRLGRANYLEQGYIASVGTREYVRVAGDDRDLRGGGYARVGFSLTVGRQTVPLPPLFPSVGAGVGGSGGFGFVILPGESAGMRVGGFLGPHVRVDVGPISIYTRVHFFERLHELEAVTGRRLASHRAVYGKLELQYRFSPGRWTARRKERRARRTDAR